jgi:ABC-2 type transport system ATP-binding protein
MAIAPRHVPNALAVSTAGLVKSYRHARALRGVDLSIGQGESVGIVGPNGAGKTTLLDIMCGLVAADSGAVTLFGQHPRQAESAGFVGRQFEVPVTFPHLRPKAIARAFGFKRSTSERFVSLLIDLNVPDHPTRAFSKGELVKLGLAVAFARSCPLVILDEPTSGLDPMAVEQAEFLCQQFLKSGGTLIVATHRLEDVRALTERTLLLNEGNLLFDGETSKFLARSVRITLRTVPDWLADEHLCSTVHRLIPRGDDGSTEVVSADPAALLALLQRDARSPRFTAEPSLAAGVRWALLPKGEEDR